MNFLSTISLLHKPLSVQKSVVNPRLLPQVVTIVVESGIFPIFSSKLASDVLICVQLAKQVLVGIRVVLLVDLGGLELTVGRWVLDVVARVVKSSKSTYLGRIG